MYASTAECSEKRLKLFKIAFRAGACPCVHIVFFLRILCRFIKLIDGFDFFYFQFIQNILADIGCKILTLMDAGQEIVRSVHRISAIHVAVNQLIGIRMTFRIRNFIEIHYQAFGRPRLIRCGCINNNDVVFFPHRHERINLLIPLVISRTHDFQLHIRRFLQCRNNACGMLRIIKGH